MTPGLYVEWLVEPQVFDIAEFGEDAVERGCDRGLVVVREELEWLEHDGEGGVYARFARRGDDHPDVYMSDDALPVWRVVAE